MIHIIGGAGFVGTRLAKVFSQTEQEFRIFDKALEGDSFIDIAELQTFDKLPPADVVINLAAEHRDDVSPKSLYDRVNVEGSKNVCNYCRANNINTIVFTSSVAVYGFAPEGTDEGGPLNPFNDYGRTKMEAEAVYKDWLSENKRERSLVIVRPAVIFGEQNRGNVYNLLNLISGNRFVMFGNGCNRKSMAYVQNVAEFLAFSISLGVGAHLYNYIDKPDLDMNTLVTRSRSLLLGKNGAGFRLPGWIGVFIGQCCDIISAVSRKQLPVSSIRVKKFMLTSAFNTSVGKTGFIPSTTLEEGLDRTLKYEFLEEHLDDELFYSE